MDTSKKKVSIWLAKFPEFLKESIKNCNKEIEIGTLDIKPATPKEPAEISLKINKIDNLPSDYQISFTDTSKNLFIYDEIGKKIEGVVVKECFITCEMNEEYLDFIEKRQEIENERKSEVKMLDYFTDIKRGDIYRPSFIDIQVRKRRKALQEKKRERLPRDEVINLIFKAYEKYDKWTIKDLADYTGQPLNYIGDIINDICEIDKKDHKSTYTLKSEYYSRK